MGTNALRVFDNWPSGSEAVMRGKVDYKGTTNIQLVSPITKVVNAPSIQALSG